jgi:hypothetical protein
MATISFSIPDDKITGIVDAICAYFDYNNSLLEGETKAQFAKRMMATQLKSWVVSIPTDVARRTLTVEEPVIE